MKNLLLIFALLISIVDLSAQEKKNGYEIVGKIKGLDDGEKVRMNIRLDISGLKSIDTDSAIVTKGVFKLAGHITDGPRLCYINFSNHPNTFLVLMLDNEQVSITSTNYEVLPNGNIRNFMAISGSKASEELKDMAGLISICSAAYFEGDTYLQNLKNTGDFDKNLLEGFFYSRRILNAAIYNVFKITLTSQPHNQIIPFVIMNLFPSIGKEKYAIDIYNALDDRAKNSYYGKLLQQSLLTDITQPVPDFKAYTVAGMPYSIKDSVIKNKLTLVYFWTSKSNLNEHVADLTKSYFKYHDKGLGIVSVCLDADKSLWMKKVKTDQLPWPQISEKQGSEGEILKLCGYIPNVSPYNLLIDDKGKIIAWQVEGVSLEYYLAKTFVN